MRVKVFRLCLFVIAVVGTPWANAQTAPAANFTITHSSRIPGDTLEPGSYSIHIINRLSDRVIIAVDAANGNLRTTFLGIPNSRIDKPSRSGPVIWGNPVNGDQYLKGWYFSDGSSVVEFVYPKAEAVAIATSNPANVPAIDPASEGKISDNTLSKDDMKLLTLWLLSFEQVSPDNKTSGIKAVRYQETASVSHKPVISSLPHTASQVPLIWLVGLCSLAAAVILRLFLSQRRSLSMTGMSRRE